MVEVIYAQQEAKARLADAARYRPRQPFQFSCTLDRIKLRSGKQQERQLRRGEFGGGTQDFAGSHIIMDAEPIPNKPQTGGKSVRLVRPSIVVLCGPAACGKSHFAERHFRPTQIVSSDWARARVCDDERDQRFNAQAFALVHFLVEQRLMLNRLCVVDSTALTGPARKDLLDLAKKHQVTAVAIVFDVPLETCVERDQKRERSVGRAVIERHHQAFELAKAALPHEGFDQVLEFQDADLDTVQIEIVFRPVARPAQRPPRPEAGNSRRPERPITLTGPRIDAPAVAGSPPRTEPVPRPAQPAAAPRPVVAPVPATSNPIIPPAAAPAAKPAVAPAPAAPSLRPPETPSTAGE